MPLSTTAVGLWSTSSSSSMATSGGSGGTWTERRQSTPPPTAHGATAAAAAAATSAASSDAAAAALMSTPVKRSAMLDFTPFFVSARYADLRLLARGSYGVVARATDRATKQAVAIKKVHAAFDTVADARHLVREVRLLRHLRHQHVLPLLDVDAPVEYKTWADVYLVMPLLDTDLEVLLSAVAAGRRKDLSDHQKRAIFYQILLAVAYLHSAGVAHRDIKPGNVLLSKSAHVMLGDLGLARYIAPGEDTGLTQAVVTKSYRAPELFLSGASEKYTSAIDLWSLGVLLFTLYSPGFPLFSHRKGEGVLAAVKLTTQLDAICRVVGTPPPSGASTSRWYMRRAVAHPPLPIDRWFATPAAAAAVPDDAKDLMLALLRFDPAERLTATAALAHPYVAEFADPAYVCTSDRPEGWADCLEPGCEGGAASPTGGKPLTREDHKMRMWAEVACFHPELAVRPDAPAGLVAAPDPDAPTSPTCAPAPRHRPVGVVSSPCSVADRVSAPAAVAATAAGAMSASVATSGGGQRRITRRYGGSMAPPSTSVGSPLTSLDVLDGALRQAASVGPPPGAVPVPALASATALPAVEAPPSTTSATTAPVDEAPAARSHWHAHRWGRGGTSAAAPAASRKAMGAAEEAGEGRVHGSHGWRWASERRLSGLFHSSQ
ncbi:hypothetical protein MMPV_001253 [Pyropia vietnamensis]